MSLLAFSSLILAMRPATQPPLGQLCFQECWVGQLRQGLGSAQWSTRLGRQGRVWVPSAAPDKLGEVLHTCHPSNLGGGRRITSPGHPEAELEASLCQTERAFPLFKKHIYLCVGGVLRLPWLAVKVGGQRAGSASPRVGSGEQTQVRRPSLAAGTSTC